MKITTFSGYTSVTPIEEELSGIIRKIKEDAELTALTAAYRSTGNRSLKEASPCFAPACRFKEGKQRRNIISLTGLSMADFDHLTAEQMEKMVRLTRNDPHTLLAYVTISGNGLRILFRYELDTSFSLEQQILFYKKVFLTTNRYYSALLGAEPDGQCKNITRLSGMCHDANVFYNSSASPFTAGWMDSQWHDTVLEKKKEKTKRREQTRLQRFFESTLVPELEAEGASFAPGRHNDFIMRLGYRLNQYGIPPETALAWAVPRFAGYADTEQVIRSCYQRTEEFGTRNRQPERDTKPNEKIPYASIEDIKHFLSERVRLRYNTITSRVEYAPAEGTEESDVPDFQVITDRVVNSLWSELSQSVRVNIQDIYRVIESDFIPDFHPFINYLDGLPPWREGDRDYLSELASTVTVAGGKETRERFARYLRKWLVAMIASWLSPEVVNNVILILIGPQGAYKTTWFNLLLPPELRRYFYTKTNSQRLGKDDLLALAQYGLICCEELDTLRPVELNQLKAAVTMPTVDERAAYARYAEHRTHIASFCGTGNNVQFLSDPTGNRRWLPFEVSSIQSPRDHPFAHRGIYSQALALFRGDFRFWFSTEEIRELNCHNRRYETPKLEQELIMLYFRKPSETEHGQFMPTARILQYIGCNLTQQLNAVNIGRALTELGFERKTYQHVRGFIVVPRNGDEMAGFQKTLAIQALPDSV